MGVCLGLEGNVGGVGCWERFAYISVLYYGIEVCRYC